MKNIFTITTLSIVLMAVRAWADPAPDASWLMQLKDPTKRLETEWNIRMEKDPAKIPGLVSLLQSQDSCLKIMSLQILSEAGDPTLWKTVVPLLKDTDPAVRESAARALASLGDRGALPYLMETIHEGMNLGNATVYWVLPSDVTDNFRYACVESINRLAKQNFKYTRAVNNFGRIYWMSKIDKWWNQEQAFFTPAFQTQQKSWRDLKTGMETLQTMLAKQVEQDSPAAQELQGYWKDVKEHVEAIGKTVESANPSAEEMREHSEALRKMLLPIDEVFVYAQDLAEAQDKWNIWKAELTTALETLSTFI